MPTQRFEILNSVGAGNFGIIRRGVDHEAKTADEGSVAIKEMKRPINLELLNREIKLQYRSQVTCSNVVQLHHIIESRSDDKYLLVMELLPMDLRSFLTAFYCPHRASLLVSPSPTSVAPDYFQSTYGRRYLPLPYVKRVIHGLINALAAVHAQGIAHRDVKPENILIEPLGLACPLRGVHTPSVIATGSSSTDSDKTCEARAPPSPHTTYVAMQDGMSVDEIIAATRAVHCPKCHALLSQTQPRMAALTAAALRVRAGMKVNPTDLTDSRKAAESPDWQPSTGTDTNAGATDSSPSEDAAIGTQGSSLSDNDNAAAGGAPDSPAATTRDWFVKAAPSVNVGTAVAVTTDPLDNVLPPSVVVGAIASPDALLACPLRPEVKLGDFGSARDLRSFAGSTTEVQRRGLTGSPTTYVYCAPEMMLQQAYTTAVDMWAAGMILFELATGELLLRPGLLVRLDGSQQVNSDFSTTYRLMRMIYMLGTPSAADWTAIANPSLYPDAMRTGLPQIGGSPLFDAAAEAAAAHSATGAPTTKAATAQTTSAVPSTPPVKLGAHRNESRILGRLVHDSLGVEGTDLLRRLTTYNPADRITAQEALKHPFFNTL